MIDSIQIGMSGLTGFSQGLRVIANNTANLNTPGFKTSMQQFSDASYSGGAYSGRQMGQLGYGLKTGGTTISFRQGEFRQTSNTLDLAVNGQGLFMLKNDNGKTSFTRDGQFQFDANGVLLSKTSGAQVMGLDAQGNIGPISIAGKNTLAGKATTIVKFAGNLSTTATEQTVAGVTIIDANGTEHTLSLKLTNTSTTTPGTWRADLMNGTTVVGTGQLVFESGRPTAASAKIAATFTPAGQAPVPLTLDFSANVTSFAPGTLANLAVSSIDGFLPADLSSTTFDAEGTLVMTYANGETVKGARLLLGRFDTPDAVGALGGNEFEALDPDAWHTGPASGAFGTIRAGFVELSNVNLSQEFSDLVIMQRGYQASSQIVSTANEMLQQLFSMKSR